MWNSIRAKLLATYLALTALGTFLLGGYLLWSFYNFFMKTKQTELETWSSALSQDVADALENNDIDRLERLVGRYGAAQTVTLRVFTADGRLLATSLPSVDRQIYHWLDVPGMKEALQNRIKSGVAKGVLSSQDRLYTTRPISVGDRRLGILRMSLTLTQFQRQFYSLVATVAIAAVLTFLLCSLISVWLARSLAMPILAMRDFAVRIGSGHLGEQLNFQGRDELGHLARELNWMSERLAMLDRERRAFLANVSHELRTPVSNVKVTLEALERGAFQEPQLCDRFMQTAHNEIDRLSRLIQDLLDLGRLEAGVASLDKQTVSLRALINRVVEAIELRTFFAGVKIHQNVPDVTLQVDSERLMQAFLNVLDNAIKYSQPNATIFIFASVEGNDAIVQIQDRGIGIDKADLPHIFDEFYRADASRQRDGTGLGLAISQRIVKAHGGGITANSTPGQGATFIVRLPIGSDRY
jgi:signal transduction histidine kinase